ncbi:RNA polymerase sigma-70 factor, ECF subfamily [Pseudomonas flavescens]|uniref:RNA polymerase sigma-70 factor, ECF subfamily n=1 Tax=Phytopseudomonas flavescens TaxID=29435 RepID=A0A1G8DY30_9GAMM|nr:sigma-70 family RNA polymerase sigma factor [Pseudomonas flavescens]SDH62577.1 RNA polymerase sigma-70 factor, ECF subfamily [Pseudomonas flavescens]
MADDIVSGLYREHSSWLQGWLYRRVGSSSQAADFAQDVFVRLLGVRQKTGCLPDLEKPRAYLATIGRHLVHDHFRRLSLERAYVEALAALPGDATLSAEELVLIQETLEQVDCLLNRMRPLVRQVFLLSQLEGLNYAQIARHLEIGERSVKRYMAQAFEACVLYVE